MPATVISDPAPWFAVGWNAAQMIEHGHARAVIETADCREALARLPDCSVDAIVTDPPYELGFMGKAWDASGIANNVEMWRECLRVLKPGGHVLAFSGSRTYHRMVVAIEDAGFEIRDQIMYLYGSGFPKSLDVSKAIDKAAGAERAGTGDLKRSGCRAARKGDELVGSSSIEAEKWKELTAPATDAARQWQGWGTALKPAHEPICVARKPLEGTVAANVLAHGTGALNIDGCRVETSDSLNGGAYAKDGGRSESQSLHGGSGMNQPGKTTGIEFVQPAGRWPANVIHDGSDEVLAAFPQAGGAQAPVRGTEASAKTDNAYGEYKGRTPSDQRDGGGSAARFFQTCESRYHDDLWHALNLPSEHAAFADATLSQQRQAVFSALVVAAKKALPAALSWDVSLSVQPTTSATPTELKRISEASTQTIRNIAFAYWLESKLTKLSLTLNPVKTAVEKTPTGITMITVSHWKSDGNAEPVTFNITPMNSEAGAKDCAPFTAADAARFKYCAKASKADRGEGNTHPTVKPNALMRYLCRLVTPPGGLVLDPFLGSGSTGLAALQEGFNFYGCDLDPAHVAIAANRMTNQRS